MVAFKLISVFFKGDFLIRFFRNKVSTVTLCFASLCVVVLLFQNCSKNLESVSKNLLSSSSESGLSEDTEDPSAGATVAIGSSVVLQPPCNSGLCGASFLGQRWLNPSMSGLEFQKTEFTLKAKDVLINSSEHIAVGLMSQDQPLNSDGSFKPTASGGAIGIAFGQLGSEFHPCPADPQNLYAEIGIEVFGSNDPLSSVIAPGCKQILKTTIAATAHLEVSVQLSCVNKICAALAIVKNASGAILATVESTGQTLRNPSSNRDIWYALTNFSADAVVESAEFIVDSESYTLTPNSAPPPPVVTQDIIFSLSTNGPAISGPVDFDTTLFTRFTNVTSAGYAVATMASQTCPPISAAYLISHNSNLIPLVGTTNSFESRVDLSVFNVTSGLKVCSAKANSTAWQVEKIIPVRAPVESVGQISYFSSRADGADRITSISQSSTFYSITKNTFGSGFYVCSEFIRASDGFKFGSCDVSNPYSAPSEWIRFDSANLMNLPHCSANSNGSTVVCRNDANSLPTGQAIGYTFNSATGLKKRSSPVVIY